MSGKQVRKPGQDHPAPSASDPGVPPRGQERGSRNGGRRRLIVNADGFGFGPGATQGILESLEGGGPITSVSVTPNFPEVERVRELVLRHPQVSIGVHVNPMAGRPCLSPELVPSLVNADGDFHGGGFLPRWRKGRISASELEAEFDAQIARVRDLAGDRLTHLDSHGNSHLHYFSLFLTLARRWGIGRMRTNASLICLEAERPRLARWRAYASHPQALLMHAYRRVQMRRARNGGMKLADRLVTVGYAGAGNKSDSGNWERILRNLPKGTYEIYCHPAYPDEVLQRWSAYCEPRLKELEILRRPALRRSATAQGIHLVSFLDLL